MNIVEIVLLVVCAHVRAETLLWSDDFNGPSGEKPNPSTWKYDIGGGGWGNQELQYYTDSPTNAALDGNGNLVITARRESNYDCWYGRCQYTSARILTAGKMSQKYGGIEARIKIPKGNGMWPAFWMLGDDLFQVKWPQCGEIDILENIGREPLAVHGTLHGPGYSGGNGLGSTYHSPNNQPFGDDFHVYRADWTPNSITFSVDGHKYATKTPADVPAGHKWVFDHSFFIILNLAVGGAWPGPPDSTTHFPQTMVIDYVKIFGQSNTLSQRRPGQIGGIGGRCVEVVGGRNENGTLVKLSDCNETDAQKWTFGDDGTVRVFDSKCLDASDSSLVRIYDCNGSDAQKWIVAGVQLVNHIAFQCMDAIELGTGTYIMVIPCNGRDDQKWKFPSF